MRRRAGAASHLQVAEAAILGGADVLQLRDKEASSGRLYRVAMQLRKLTRDANIPFIVNDRLDIALAADADGVHVGQTDLPASVVRKSWARTGSWGFRSIPVEEALLAGEGWRGLPGSWPGVRGAWNEAGCRRALGVERIARIRRHCRLPIVAIGGIDAENAGWCGMRERTRPP